MSGRRCRLWTQSFLASQNRLDPMLLEMMSRADRGQNAHRVRVYGFQRAPVPRGNGFAAARKKIEGERERKGRLRAGFAYPPSSLAGLASNKRRQGHSHWRVVCSMSSAHAPLLSSLPRGCTTTFRLALCSLILQRQLSKTRGFA